MQLSEHFSFNELTVTNNVALQEKNRSEAAKFLPALKALAMTLEDIREVTGPLAINSGFRCQELNNATPGSSPRSQHMLGQAADMHLFLPDGRTAFQVENLFEECLFAVKARRIAFGQLILENKMGVPWVHFSLGAPWREIGRCGQVLKMQDGVYTLVKKVQQV